MAQTKPRRADSNPNSESVMDEDQPETPAINYAAIALLASWLEDDDVESDEEQREALACLQAALDEHRLPGQKLFS